MKRNHESSVIQQNSSIARLLSALTDSPPNKLEIAAGKLIKQDQDDDVKVAKTGKVVDSSSVIKLFSSDLARPLFRANLVVRKRKCGGAYRIDTMRTLDDLLERLKNSPIKEGENPRYLTIRYLLSDTLELRFALEGAPTDRIPPHFAMAGVKKQYDATCTTVGNLFFDRETLHLARINNKSSDFEPTFDSIKWVLAALVANNVKLCDKIILERIPNRVDNSEFYTFSKEEIISAITQLFADSMQLFVQSNAQSEPRTYELDNLEKNMAPTQPHRRIQRPNFDLVASPIKDPALRSAVEDSNDSTADTLLQRMFGSK